MTDYPRTYSVTEIAERLGKSRMWLVLRLRNGTFGGRKIGREWRLTEADYDAILAATERRPVAPVTSATRTTRRRLERN